MSCYHITLPGSKQNEIINVLFWESLDEKAVSQQEMINITTCPLPLPGMTSSKNGITPRMNYTQWK